MNDFRHEMENGPELDPTNKDPFEKMIEAIKRDIFDAVIPVARAGTFYKSDGNNPDGYYGIMKIWQGLSGVVIIPADQLDEPRQLKGARYTADWPDTRIIEYVFSPTSIRVRHTGYVDNPYDPEGERIPQYIDWHEIDPEELVHLHAITIEQPSNDERRSA